MPGINYLTMEYKPYRPLAKISAGPSRIPAPKSGFCSISGAYFFPVLIYFRCLFLLRATLDSGGRPPRAATPNRLNVICVDLMNYRCLFIFRAYFLPVLILISSHPRFWRGPDGLDFRAYFFPVLISSGAYFRERPVTLLHLLANLLPEAYQSLLTPTYFGVPQ